VPLTQSLSFHILTSQPLTRSLSFRILTSSSLCSPQLVGAPPLVAFLPAHRMLARPLAAVFGLYSWPRLVVASPPCSLPCLLPAVPAPGCARCFRLKIVEFFSGGFLSPASRFDAGGAFGSWQGQHLQWAAFPLMHACQRLRVRYPSYFVGIHNHASKLESVMGHRCVDHY
jgi:hypothetical protein